MWIDPEAPDQAKVADLKEKLKTMTFRQIAQAEGLHRNHVRLVCKRLGLIEPDPTRVREKQDA